jgi:hypothetical protein
MLSGCTRQGTEILTSEEGYESQRNVLYATMHDPLLPPSASMGVEGSGAISGSEKTVMEKSDVKESIDVLRLGGRCFCE